MFERVGIWFLDSLLVTYILWVIGHIRYRIEASRVHKADSVNAVWYFNQILPPPTTKVSSAIIYNVRCPFRSIGLAPGMRAAHLTFAPGINFSLVYTHFYGSRQKPVLSNRELLSGCRSDNFRFLCAEKVIGEWLNWLLVKGWKVLIKVSTGVAYTYFRTGFARAKNGANAFLLSSWRWCRFYCYLFSIVPRFHSWYYK